MGAYSSLIIGKQSNNPERRDIIWNMAGSFLYALASMVLTMIVVQLVGDEQGGIFTFAFTTFGQQMFMVAYFGIRPYQITDVENKYSFGDYLHLRIVTSLSAILIGIGFLFIQGYTLQKTLVVFFMVCYKVIDGFADAYEAEFQRSGRLYLTGKSNTFRTILSVSCFFISLYISRDLVLAAVVAVAAQLLGLVLFDIIIIGELPNIDWKWSPGECADLAKSCCLLFLSVFLDFYIFSAAKYAIDANMNDVAMAVFGAIFMPTSVINLVAGFVIRPFLTKLSYAWEQKNGPDFTSIIRMIFVVILGLTVLAVGGAYVLGIPVISLLYPNLKTALATCRVPLVLIILGGAFNAFMNLFYYTLVIMDCQKAIFGGYIFVCLVAIFLSPYAVRKAGLMGGAVSYLLLMMLIAVCFGIMMLQGMRERFHTPADNLK